MRDKIQDLIDEYTRRTETLFNRIIECTGINFPTQKELISYNTKSSFLQKKLHIENESIDIIMFYTELEDLECVIIDLKNLLQ